MPRGTIPNLLIGQRVELARVHHQSLNHLLGTRYTVEGFTDCGLVRCKRPLIADNGVEFGHIINLWDESFMEACP